MKAKEGIAVSSMMDGGRTFCILVTIVCSTLGVVLVYNIFAKPGVALDISRSSPISELDRITTHELQTPNIADPEKLSLADEFEDLTDFELDYRMHEKKNDSRYESVKMQPFGIGSYLFIHMSAYRVGLNSFALVGLGPRALHQFGNPGFQCEWVDWNGSSFRAATVRKFIPDHWDFSRQYKTVVVHCTFEREVGSKEGGELKVVATHGTQDGTGLGSVRYVALKESRQEYNAEVWSNDFEYPYDILYCGSPLFGDLSPQKIREWVAYHAYLSKGSHFLMYDAGGIDENVMRVLEPWIKIGRVTVLNVRHQERYDSYYHNQFMIVNDCLFRSITLAKWAFFFDVDEFLATRNELKLEDLLASWGEENYAEIKYIQSPMSIDLCRRPYANKTKSSEDRQWEIERQVYRRVSYSHKLGDSNRKYALQPRMALTAGVHYSTDLMGPSLKEDKRLTYYHFHGAINKRGDVCVQHLESNVSSKDNNKFSYSLDNTLARAAQEVKEYEFQQVGSQPYIL